MARIIVVDDSPLLVKQLRKFLEAEGHEVVAVGQDGIEGVDLYLEHRPDLILLDITMPRKDGLQCMEEILRADKSARAMIVSAVKDRKVIMSCLNGGARGYIEKPLRFNDEDFCNEFRQAIVEATDN